MSDQPNPFANLTPSLALEYIYLSLQEASTKAKLGDIKGIEGKAKALYVRTYYKARVGALAEVMDLAGVLEPWFKKLYRATKKQGESVKLGQMVIKAERLRN